MYIDKLYGEQTVGISLDETRGWEKRVQNGWSPAKCLLRDVTAASREDDAMLLAAAEKAVAKRNAATARLMIDDLRGVYGKWQIHIYTNLLIDGWDLTSVASFIRSPQRLQAVRSASVSKGVRRA